MNDEVATNKVSNSMAVLIQGKMQVEFRDTNLTLSRFGDYVLWEPGVPHSWTALEITILFTARSPSLPNGQIITASFKVFEVPTFRRNVVVNRTRIRLPALLS